MMTRACLILLASAACATPAKSSPRTTPGTDQPRTVIAPDTQPADQQPGQGEPACPSIQVKAPDSVSAGTQARISTTLVGIQGTATFKWTVTGGKLASGQGTPTIMVDTAGLAGASVTATVELGGLSKQCVTTTASASVLVGP
jgi:hypothetical protein